MILVVDDEECVIRLDDAILTRKGFQVISARTGHAALDAVKLKAGRIAAVLLDVHLPDVDGVSLIPILRQTYPDLAVILTSGYPVENEFGEFGPHVSFLQKPYKSHELVAAVHTALRSFPVREQSAA